MIPFGVREPPLNEFDFPGRRRDPLRRFLLKNVQYINRVLDLDGINRPLRIPLPRGRDFHYARSAKSFQWLRGRIGLALLRCKQCLPYVAPDVSRERLQVPAG